MKTHEYIKQIKKHRARIAYLGKLHGDPAVKTACAIHDYEKIILLPFLLFFNLVTLPKTARLFYDFMNRIGKMIFEIKMKEFTSSQKQHALFVEKCFDCLDRNMDPEAEKEFKRPNQPLGNYLNPTEMEYIKNWVTAWRFVNKIVKGIYD